jgi:hypothetical protein
VIRFTAGTQPIRTTRNNPYDVNAAFMSSERRESGIHAVSEARDRRAGRLLGCCLRGAACGVLPAGEVKVAGTVTAIDHAHPVTFVGGGCEW